MYYSEPGRQHTKETLELAIGSARKRGIANLVVASSCGYTAEELEKLDLSGLRVVVVTHAYGYAEKGKCQFPDALRQRLEGAGIRVLTTTHVLSGAERGLVRQYGGMYPIELVAHTLRMFGAGIKVCVEIPIMALDAGLIPYGEKVVAVGGTHSGADAAAVVSPEHANNVMATKVHEILCKPL